MAKAKTPQLDALIAQEPDLVDRIFEYLLAEFPQIAGPKFAVAKKAVRDEFAGQDAYIPQRPLSERQELVQSVLSLFNGRNATEVARRLCISRATVYRVLKQEGGQKKASQLSGN
jgi:Mor family transcriptional regulator